ncbi:Thiosulfate reductase cytochrome b subunit [Altererythrobacter xiamenensis]|uniref:Thiosulfate reductase cytochrome b subunit n=1 Tax=Altererythrobacter xiamenensis TaxID=1316679 RepID=A0A1Y6E5M7_9SPHN|nr:cytochrome b/b6 domain-containing protein [Altererythrobacter xiamenensis]SMQ58055.1 Thiosulfate reductase cytochrome b subunit [Altererythrobacter xiamenensis]
MKKHALSTRLWHWLNLVCIIVLFMSGLNISNAHRYLYWGEYGFSPADAWTSVIRFPGWATIPGYYNLAEARDWHILMAWPFALGLLFIWVAMLANKHFWRDLRTTREEWTPRAIWQDIVDHLKFRFDHDGGYNFLQKLTYGVVLGIFLPVMVFSGMAISPGIEPSMPWLVDIFGGRQSARSIHFITAWAIAGFFVVHVLLVLVTGPIRQIRGMITGGRK